METPVVFCIGPPLMQNKGAALLFQLMILPKYIFEAYHWVRNRVASRESQLHF